jgi:hypothetical protein
MSTARTDRFLVALRVVPEKWDHRNGARARHCGRVGLSGAALFTVFVKGAGFSSLRNTPRAKKGQTRIGQRERENRGSESPHP